ncbi:MAG: hypothetical protein KAV87_12955 [Desulfobacteraceae bacterium]|nr:hypothetical protein [Desulfobacteraceae bacterium]
MHSLITKKEGRLEIQSQVESDFLNRKLSPDFRAREFVCSCCKKEGVRDEVVMRLQFAHDRLPKPNVIIINSGYRCLKHNRSPEVGSDDTSSHPKGYAVDIKCTTSRCRFQLLKALIEAGFTRIGIRINKDRPEKSFIHADCDPDKDPEVIWGY